jgi:hypothetical protein
MAIKIEDIQKALQNKSEKYSKMQSNIDINKNDNSINQFSLAIINAQQIEGNLCENMLNENQDFADSRNGLQNKIIVYKPKNTAQITNIAYYIAETSNQNHAGIYYCDEQKNIYRLSPDYRFNELITQSLLTLCSSVSEIQKCNSYSYAYVNTNYNTQISKLSQNISELTTKISALENRILQLENQISDISYM